MRDELTTTQGHAVPASGSASGLIAEDRPRAPVRWMTVPTMGTVFEHTERGQMVDLAYEEREWICVFCKEPQPYVLINGYCEIGCGVSSQFYNGRRADHCSKPECMAAAARFLQNAKAEQP